MRLTIVIAATSLSLLAWNLTALSSWGQSISNAGVSAALLALPDLSGFHQTAETSQTNSNSVNGVSVAMVRMRRMFVADGGGATLSAELLQVMGGDPSAFDPSQAGESLLLQAAGADGAQVSGFALLGPLGLGEADQAASWSAVSPQGDQWSFVADVFRRGHVLATVVYAVPSADGDVATLTAYAQQQDAKLAAAGLG
jgi:hypothetical protein